MRLCAYRTGPANLLVLSLGLAGLLLSSAVLAARDAQLEATIEHLIGHVADSRLTFVRNFSDYSGGEASAHMRKKYEHFQDEIRTPEEFIELCASRSLVTGKDYLVVTADGHRITTRQWLGAELLNYREQVNGVDNP